MDENDICTCTYTSSDSGGDSSGTQPSNSTRAQLPQPHVHVSCSSQPQQSNFTSCARTTRYNIASHSLSVDASVTLIQQFLCL